MKKETMNDKPSLTITTKLSASPIAKDELSRNAMGGTELQGKALYDHLGQEFLEPFQIIPSRVRKIEEGKIPILWLHDLPGDPESEHLKDEKSRERFKGMVFVSNWQMQMYNMQLGVPYAGNNMVLQNAIEPFTPHDKPDDGIIRLIYHTTPHRGLGILVPVFEKICEQFDNVELDVYSSFSIYGWPERDAHFEPLFDRIKAHPKMHYHGAVPNAEVRKALQKAHIFAYPSIWPETSCIAAIEALAAGCITVCPNYAALPETTANFAWMYQFSETAHEHANRFANVLVGAIQAVASKNENLKQNLNHQTDYFNHFYNWEMRAYQWKSYLSQFVD